MSGGPGDITDFTEDQIRRYARHITLPEVGGTGQARLMQASVLVVGAGGLGSPLLMYLAAAGIGHLGVIDDDIVDLTNLQRQIIHTTDRIGQPKVESALATLNAINPEVRVTARRSRLTPGNAGEIIAGYDVVADGSDNFATRYLLNDACYFAKRPLVSAAMLRFDAQLATFRAFDGDGRPCYRCIFPEAPDPGLIPSCAEGGVLGALPGAIGSLQAVEVIKEILGIGEGLARRMMLFDTLHMDIRQVNVARDPQCALCGDHPTITDLSHHAAGTPEALEERTQTRERAQS